MQHEITETKIKNRNEYNTFIDSRNKKYLKYTIKYTIFSLEN